jgi:cytochrome c biogenesis protein CcdA
VTTLALVGLLSGLVTAISPCVLPVLPVVLTTSIAREASRWRPFVVVGGLVVSFGTFTLLGGALTTVTELVVTEQPRGEETMTHDFVALIEL